MSAYFKAEAIALIARILMNLIQSARINGYDPYAYLKDVLERLPRQRASEIEQLLPHQWVSA